jgi:hypothetical protein
MFGRNNLTLTHNLSRYKGHMFVHVQRQTNYCYGAGNHSRGSNDVVLVYNKL